MSVLVRVMLIQYFTACLINYFYNSKTEKKRSSNMIVHFIEHLLKKEKIIFHICAYSKVIPNC